MKIGNFKCRCTFVWIGSEEVYGIRRNRERKTKTEIYHIWTHCLQNKAEKVYIAEKKKTNYKSCYKHNNFMGSLALGNMIWRWTQRDYYKVLLYSKINIKRSSFIIVVPNSLPSYTPWRWRCRQQDIFRSIWR